MPYRQWKDELPFSCSDSVTSIVVKDKDVPSVEEEEDEMEENKKRHLNAVFIGHVGELMNFIGFFFFFYVVYQDLSCLCFI